MGLTTHTVSDEREFWQMESDWNSLLSRCPNPSIFSTFEWLSTWWTHFKAGRELFIVVAEEDGEVAGIAPLAITRGRLGNVLQFLGQQSSDYGDFIVPGESGSCLTSLLSSVFSSREWEVASLAGIPGDSSSFDALVSSWEGARNGAQYRPSVVSPYLRLGQSWEHYRSGLRKKLVADTDRQMRRLQQVGNLSFQRCSRDEDIDQYVDEMVLLKRARYRATGAKDIFQDGKLEGFYRDVSRKLLRRGWLDLSYMELNGIPLALHFGFIYSGRFHYYMPSFRQEYASFSPGRLLTFHLLKNAFESELDEFDFLTGDDQYKYDWTGDIRTVYAFSAQQGGLRSKLLHQLREGVVPALRSSSTVRKLIRRWRRRNGNISESADRRALPPLRK